MMLFLSLRSFTFCLLIILAGLIDVEVVHRKKIDHSFFSIVYHFLVFKEEIKMAFL